MARKEKVTNETASRKKPCPTCQRKSARKRKGRRSQGNRGLAGPDSGPRDACRLFMEVVRPRHVLVYPYPTQGLPKQSVFSQEFPKEPV